MLITHTFTIVAFLAGFLVVFGVMMLLRDLFTRRGKSSRHPLGVDAALAEELGVMPPEPVDRLSLDRGFHRLIAESGIGLDPAAALAVVFGTAVVGGCAPFFLLDSLLGAAAGLLIGALVPIGCWSVVRWRRMRAMRRQLPEALEIVADNVRSGRNLEQAAEMVAQEVPAPMGKEFERAAAQFSLGHTPIAVLEGMVRRVSLPEFRVFATAVLVHRRAGGNLALLTQRLAHSARDRLEVLGHLKAVSAGSRISAVGLILGAMLGMAALTSIEPDYVDFFINSQTGLMLLLTAIGLQLVGIAWVWRVMRIKY